MQRVRSRGKGEWKGQNERGREAWNLGRRRKEREVMLGMGIAMGCQKIRRRNEKENLKDK